MYCENCKKKFSENAKYCDTCGEKLIEKEINEEKNIIRKIKKKKKKTGLIITLVISGIVSVIGSTVFFGVSLFKYIDKMGKLEYIELGNDKIPTLYMSNNDIQIDSYNKETSLDEIEVEIEYYDNLYQDNMIDTYVELLEENGFTCVDIDDDDWYLVKKSVDKGKVITINIYENSDYDGELFFTIVYEKEKDKISNHIKEIIYKRVGEAKYGFIDIDSTWQPYMETKDMIQYEGVDGFLTLYYVENLNINVREYMTEIYNSVSIEGAIDLAITEVTVDGYNAYQLFGYYPYEKAYIAIWCFLDNNNILHYIEIDSSKNNSEAFSKIESYSVLQ